MNADIQFQIEVLSKELVKMLMEEYGWELEKSLDVLYNFETFRKINDPKCGFYYEGAVYMFSYLKNEIETGVFQ